MSNKPPVYSRLLRLRHVRLRPLTAFLLFEGSFALGILLVMADIVTVWGVVAVPAAVAAMVKFNDVIAGRVNRPGGPTPVPAPRPRKRPAVGRSAVPEGYGPTGIGVMPTVATAGPRTSGRAKVVARGRASVRSRDDLALRPDRGDRRGRGNTGRFGG